MNTFLTRLLGVLAVVALAASACGSDTATTSTATDDPTDMSDMDMSDHATMLEVDPNLPIPGVEIELTETKTPGLFDLEVSLTNFTVSEENLGSDPVDNEGHMHLLIDGVKIERFTELSSQAQVPEGEHLVEVELNANNHSPYAIDGEPIRAGVTVTGFGEAVEVDSAGHDDDHGDVVGAVKDGLTMSDAEVTLTATLADGQVSVDGQDRLQASVGDVVAIMINSDSEETAHLHGYDILVELTPGETSMMLFTADTAGRFELELEESETFVAELVVS